MITALEMEPGDIIEFLSDYQTDKGPCTGVCLANDGSYVTLSYSDVEKKEWAIAELDVNSCRNRDKFGDAFWELT